MMLINDSIKQIIFIFKLYKNWEVDTKKFKKTIWICKQIYFNNYFYECIKIENKYLYYTFCNIDIINSFIFEYNITK